MLRRLVSLAPALSLAALLASASPLAHPTPAGQDYYLLEPSTASSSAAAAAAALRLPSGCILATATAHVDDRTALKLHALAPGCTADGQVGISLRSARAGSTLLLATRDAIQSPTLAEQNQDWQERLADALARPIASPTEEPVTAGGDGQLIVQQQAIDQPLEPTLGPAQILHLAEQGREYALVEVSAAQLSRIDTVLPRDTRVRRLVFHAASNNDNDNGDEPAKPEPTFPAPRYNHHIDRLISSSAFDEAKLRADVRVLTGEEAPATGPRWTTRHSATYSARLAARWIRAQMVHSLRNIAGAKCELQSYDEYFSPNVVCTIPASPAVAGNASKDEEGEGAVIISAHYDSRGSFGSTTAPGGDDDGSGTTALLAIARALGHAATATDDEKEQQQQGPASPPLSFSSPVHLVFFSGEEQGLIGSQHYAATLRSTGTRVKLALQMDMLAYRAPHEPLQLAFPDKLSTRSATAFIRSLAGIYVPELVTGYTPACCSDHQSFWEVGFPATWVFERNGEIADPEYHQSGDVSGREGWSWEQLRAAGRVVAASLAVGAGVRVG